MDSTLAELRAWLNAHVPDGAVSRVAPVVDHTQSLFPEESDLIQKAIQKRRAEFSTGRVLARKALSDLGIPQSPILTGNQRKPLWPEGVRASITHSQDICAVVVGPTRHLKAVGLDLEGIAGVGDDVARYVSTQEELTRNADQLPPKALNAAVFSIREAIFKAYYPETGVYLNFGDVSLDLDASQGRFEAQLINDTRPDLLGKRTIKGRFLTTDSVVLSLITL